MRFLKNGKLGNQMCLVVYLEAFDKKTSYLLRDKQSKTLHQEFMTAIEIENNIKCGLTWSHFFRNVCQQNEVQMTNQCHKECLISDQQVGTTVVVSIFVENSELKTYENEVSLLQRRVDSFLAENSACVYNITVADDKVDSLDELYIQDINSIIPSMDGY